jgi:TP901-1 family phage major tail protein
MAAQKGKDVLLKVDALSNGTFVTVAGLRTRRLAFSTATVDVTNADSTDRWRELLAGAGAKRASVSGGGVFKDVAADETVRGIFFNATIAPWRIILPGFGTVEGLFQLTALDYAGDHDGEVTFDLTLESAGSLTFTAG